MSATKPLTDDELDTLALSVRDIMIKHEVEKTAEIAMATSGLSTDELNSVRQISAAKFNLAQAQTRAAAQQAQLDARKPV